MAETTIKVTGVREVTNSLNQYSNEASRLQEANNRIASKVAQTAVATAPRLSGQLARSIRPRVLREKVELVASTPYAGVIEYGNPYRNLQAQPYLVPAVQRNMDFIVQQYEANLDALKRQYI